MGHSPQGRKESDTTEPLHYYGGPDDPICRAAAEPQAEKDCGHGEAGEGEGGTNGENSLEAYTSLYAKQPASGNLLYDSGSSHRGSVTT